MQREVNLLPSSYDLSINWICSVLVGNWSIHLAQWGKRESFLAPKRAQINGELVNSVKCDLSSPISVQICPASWVSYRFGSYSWC